MNDLPAIRALLDKNEIAELLTGYLRAIDRGDIATLRASYAPGATITRTVTAAIWFGVTTGYLILAGSYQVPRRFLV